MSFIRQLLSPVTKPRRVGWITYDSFLPSKKRFDQLVPFTRMRAGNIAEWINAHSDTFHNELYHPERRYDIVVFQKMMDERCQAEARRIQAYGGKVIFDANVNYYEIWGDYFVPDTCPTEEQQRDAIWMTGHADWVVADSSYIADIACKFNPHVTWIPDNVDLAIYRGVKKHRPKFPVLLVWSGVGKKAQHLLLIRDVLARLQGMELVLVCDELPDILGALREAIPCRVVRFTDKVYARTLLACDIIISPKRLCNGYETGHTEYKITLGMAVGLPAIASPQQSYIEAISHNDGGIIARTEEEWLEALIRLANDHQLRAEIGTRARQTVLERYSTPVVAQQYLEVFHQVLDNTSSATVPAPGGHGLEICGDRPLYFRERLQYLSWGLSQLFRQGRPENAPRFLRLYPVPEGIKATPEGGATPFRVYTDALLKQEIEALCPQRAQIVDIGCGNGNYKVVFERAQISGEYFGLDIEVSPNWQALRAQTESAALKCNFARLPAEELGQLQRRFSFSMSSSALEHIRNDEKAVRELFEVMEPGAYGLHVVPSSWALFLYLYHGYRRYSPKSLARLFQQQAGFRVVRLYRLGGLFSFLFHLIWITWLETGSIYDWLLIGRVARFLKNRLTLGGRMRSDQRFLSVYSKILRLCLRLDPVIPICEAGLGIVVQKPSQEVRSLGSLRETSRVEYPVRNATGKVANPW